MESRLHNDRLIVRYLLDELPEPEQLEFEEQYLADQDCFEQVRAVEEELIADYVRGRLSERERRRFERHYLATPERRARVAFARTLLEVAAEQMAAASSARTAPSPVAWWQALRASLRPLTVGLALAALLLLALSGGLVFERQHLRDRLGRTQSEQAALQQREQELARQVAAERAANEQLAAARAALARREQELERQLAAARQPSPPSSAKPPSLIIAALDFPPVERGGEKKSLLIPPRENLAQLRVALGGDEYRSYCVTLEAVSGGETIWTEQGLKAVSRPGQGQAVVVNVPVSKFTGAAGADYRLILSWRSAAGQCQEIGRYRFQVVRP